MKHTVVVTVAKGKLQTFDRQHFQAGVARLPDGAYELTLVPIQETRSTAANRYYYGVVLEAIYQACERQHTKDEIHDDMCDRFLKYRLLQVDHRTGEVIERVVAGRSSRLKVSAFYDFVEQVRAWASEFFPDIDIPDPDKDYKQHREQARAKAAKAATAA